MTCWNSLTIWMSEINCNKSYCLSFLIQPWHLSWKNSGIGVYPRYRGYSSCCVKKYSSNIMDQQTLQSPTSPLISFLSFSCCSFLVVQIPWPQDQEATKLQMKKGWFWDSFALLDQIISWLMFSAVEQGTYFCFLIRKKWLNQNLQLSSVRWQYLLKGFSI